MSVADADVAKHAPEVFENHPAPERQQPVEQPAEQRRLGLRGQREHRR